MVKTVLSVDSLVCDMCDAHMNDAIRRAFKVKKVTSSHAKGETVIITKNELTREDIEKAVSETGYRILSMKTEPYEKKACSDSEKCTQAARFDLRCLFLYLPHFMTQEVK